MQQRRRRLRRRIAIAVLATTVTAVGILLNRDAQSFRAARKQGETIAAALQETYGRRRDPPLSFPILHGTNAGLHSRYYFNMFYASQQESNRLAGVCCMRQPEHFFVRSAGRIVILFDGSKFSSQWMPEEEFQADADALGFGSLREKQR